MTRKLRRAALTAVVIATPLCAVAGPALAASAAPPAATGVVVTNPGHPHGQPNRPDDRWHRKPASRPTPPATPGTSRPTPPATPGASRPTSSPTVRPTTSAPGPTSSPTVTPTTSTAPPATSNDFETQVVALTNTERLSNGCGALRIDSRLIAAARAHSSDMIAQNFFSHTGSNGSDFVAREVTAGYPKNGASAENIAWGYRTPQEVVTGWMNSAGHRANILDCSSTAVGVGIATTSIGTIYWTQDFGRI
ncbi:CAP domain-containing protein [Actinoplanes palleronii]|uniref:SCP domain-containing protein n=1 Tax=Actinoplanes palleronii TaxID=113570 RepID=A0ABQ4BFS0_9ACTN|nr:CAP domain-containing protein [Actinoplanes palleronii]GIE69519.1 hypothetical protein Apa02nite_056270 [Actinoplanes palleronii]